MSSSYMWEAFNLHQTLFLYVPYPRLFKWDGKHRKILWTPRRHLIPWFFAVFVTIITFGLVAAVIILLAQMNGNANVKGLGLLTTLQTIVIALFSLISGGTAIAGLVHGERTAEFFNRLLSLDKYIANEIKGKRMGQNTKKTTSRFLNEERVLELMTKLSVVGAALCTVPVTTLAVIENMEPFGNMLECFILPPAYHRTRPTIVAIFMLRLIMAWIATVETARSSSFLVLVFNAVIQIYLKLLHQFMQCSIQKQRRILKYYISLQTVHVDAEPCGNILIAILMMCAIMLYTISIWMTINCWEKVPMFVYWMAFSFSLFIPFVIMSLMPYAVKIHGMSTALISNWKTESAAKWYSNSYDRKWIKRRVKAVRRIAFSCGIHFQLKHSTKMSYLQVIIDQALDSLIAIPAT